MKGKIPSIYVTVNVINEGATMVRFEKDGEGNWIERVSHPHHGSGRRRRYGFTVDGVRITRPCMVRRQRPPKRGGRK